MDSATWPCEVLEPARNLVRMVKIVLVADLEAEDMLKKLPRFAGQMSRTDSVKSNWSCLLFVTGVSVNKLLARSYKECQTEKCTFPLTTF